MKNNNLLLLFIALFAVALIFYSRFQSKTSQKPVDLSCPDCNVLFVAFDALQASHVSSFGYSRNTTPTIDFIARDGVSFTKTISAASWTVPSYMSIFTGLFPTEHKVTNKFVTFTPEKQVVTNLANLSPNVRTLAQVFKDNGYITGGFTGDAGVGTQFGYAQGFDIYKDNETFGPMSTAADQALAWLKENEGKKFFLFLQGYDSHGQFKLPEGYKGRFMDESYKGQYKGTAQEQRDLREKGLTTDAIDMPAEDVEFWRQWYDSKIADADERFSKFWQEFETMGLPEKTIVVIFSDHGTEFFEHKKMDHGHTVYNELVNVPVILRTPSTPKNIKINALTSTLDIAPTVLDMLNITPDSTYENQKRGMSLVPYISNQAPESRDVFIETDYRNYTHKRAVQTSDGWKYIITMDKGIEELYNLTNDPGETTNLATDNPEKVSELKQKVMDHLKAMGSDPNGPWVIGCLPVYGDQCKN